MRPATQRMVSAGYLKSGEATNPLVVLLRALAIPLVVLGVRTRIHPILVTFVSLGIALTGCWLYVEGEAVGFITLWSVAVLLDYVDGGIARKSGKTTWIGYVLDMVGDRLKLVTLLLASIYVDRSLGGLAVVLTTITLLVTTDIASHLFIPRERGSPGILGWPPARILLEFDMHSFLIYAAALVLNDGSLVPNAWLMTILVIWSASELHRRVRHDGEGSILELNTRYMLMADALARRTRARLWRP